MVAVELMVTLADGHLTLAVAEEIEGQRIRPVTPAEMAQALRVALKSVESEEFVQAWVMDRLDGPAGGGEEWEDYDKSVPGDEPGQGRSPEGGV